MKVQLKSPLFEVSEEEFEKLKRRKCALIDCLKCPVNIDTCYCGLHILFDIGYTLEEVE